MLKHIKEITGARIKLMRNELGITQEELAIKVGLSNKSSIATYEAGRSLPPDDIKFKMCELFECSLDYLTGNSNERNSATTMSDLEATETDMIPIVGEISAGKPILAVENIEGEFGVPSNIVKGDKKDYFLLRVKGDSMNCLFNDGNLVLIKKDIDFENGSICAVRIENEVTIKKVQVKERFAILEPCSTNPIHTAQIYDMEEVDVEIIGKATYFIGKI